MIDRFFASRGRAAATAISAFVALAGVTAAGAAMSACSSDDVSVDQQIKNFCTSYMASQGFACCNAADKASGTFADRYGGYTSVDTCVQSLTARASAGQTFDGTAASSCLQYAASRSCGDVSLLADRIAAEQAGCGRVLKGNVDVGGACATEGDCKVGLFCPSVSETGTGTAVCAKPAGISETCFQNQVESVDHPACADGLICLFNTTVTVCPVPPCPEYRCVPRVTVVADTTQAEECTGTDCVSGATCTDVAPDPTTGHQFVCQNGTTGAAAGKGCRVSEQCAPGLYCDGAKGLCAARKTDGQPCSTTNNPRIFECVGTCSAGGTCTSFCGKG